MSLTPSSLFLTLLDERVHVAAVGLDPLEHLEHRLVRAAVQRPEQRVDAGGDRGEQVRLRGADQAHRGRRAVLLVVRVQDEQQVERLRPGPGRPRSRLGGDAERHPQEVLDVATGSCRGRGTAGRRSSCRRTPRSSAAWPSGARSRSRPAPGRTGRGCPGRTSTARDTAEDSTGIGCASRGKPLEEALEVLVQQGVAADPLRRSRASSVAGRAARRRSAGRRPRGSWTSRPAARSGSRGSAGCPRRRRCR